MGDIEENIELAGPPSMLPERRPSSNKSSSKEPTPEKSERRSWGHVLAAVLFWLAIAYALACTLRIAKLTAKKEPEVLGEKSELELLSNDPIKIKFEHGSIIGAIDAETGAATYLGVPYAAPPVDRLRFRPPELHTLWKTENPFRFDARNEPSPCLSGIETLLPFDTLNDFDLRSEDCLYLNIWAPNSTLTGEIKPVLFFVHGGSFVGGNANRRETNGRKLAQEQDIVVVSVQYRLGIYGFGYMDRHGHATRNQNIGHFEQGNFGLQDVRLALRLVHENIGKFGGDPDKITIMGNSAGALITGTIMSDEAPVYFRDKDWPYYRAAIMQCTPINLQMRTPADVIQFNNKISIETGCDTFECFQQLSNDKIGEAINATTSKMLFDLTVMSLVGTPFAPIEDNITAFNVNKNNIQHDVPLMVGVNADESLSFLSFLLTKPLTNHIYEAAVNLIFGDMAAKVLEFYPTSEIDNRDNIAHIEQDAIFDCPSRRLMRNLTTSFKYRFDSHGMDSYSHWSDNLEWGQCKNAACHCTDTVYTFGQYEFDNVEQEKTARQLQSAVGSFVRNSFQPSTGQPFPESSHGTVVLEIKDGNVETLQNPNEKNCRLWDDMKERADQCGMGDESKCFINWEKLIDAVEKMRNKMQN